VFIVFTTPAVARPCVGFTATKPGVRKFSKNLGASSKFRTSEG